MNVLCRIAGVMMLLALACLSTAAASSYAI